MAVFMNDFYFGRLLMLTLVCSASKLIAQETLPVGSHPPAIVFEHFPNRIFALVWRNWNLVDPARIARTIECGVEDVHVIAAAMGLPAAQPVPPAFRKRLYITILRRNWHLLPYDQLLTLADMSTEELEFSLKEDDFLFHKFGNLKPACLPLKYTPPDHATLIRAGEIKQLVEKYFRSVPDQPLEPLFSFIRDLSLTDDEVVDSPAGVPADTGLRYLYSYFGVFGDPLLDTLNDPYPEGLLARLAARGINGIWMHVVLNQLAPGGKDFPEFGDRHQQRLINLKRIARRAERFGMKIYLYMNEPRAMPLSFFEKRQSMAGVRKGDFITMCTSNDQVRNWIRNALTYVFKEVPELGGVFTITASENLTNCASHGDQQQCPRCSKREYADIIAEVNKAIADGVHRANPEAKVIVWDWGWHGHGEAPDVISRLPKSVWLMSVSEWANPIERGGVEAKVGEYSISSVGPGPRALRHWALAKSAGLKTVAKVQFNNTWELSAIPWIPALDLIAQHAANLAKVDIDGYMLSWTLGGYPSPNLEIARQFSLNPGAEPNAVLDALAISRYGEQAAPFARKAWTSFSQAFREFPYDQRVLYSGPQQYGPANLLYAAPTGYAASMVGFPYDDLERWRGIYPAGTFVDQLEKVAKGWEEGLIYLKRLLRSCDPGKRDLALADWRIAKAAWLHFASAAGQSRFIMLRDSLARDELTTRSSQILKKHLQQVLDEEIRMATELWDIIRLDSRIGFEASNQYYYVSQDLMEKVINCEYLRKNFE
jgi:hypothetical protein